MKSWHMAPVTNLLLRFKGPSVESILSPTRTNSRARHAGIQAESKELEEGRHYLGEALLGGFYIEE